MRGYFKDPQTTAATLNDGWLRTGDHGRLDTDGYLFVTGRFKEAMVTAAGETIYPDEVEPHYESPLFTELCVTALRGEDGNDVPTLFVVSASPELPDEELRKLFASLRASAPARFRVEQWIRLNNALPRTASGKIRRRLLARQFNNREEQT
jgi:long-chain acyl-CoA synthetase